MISIILRYHHFKTTEYVNDQYVYWTIHFLSELIIRPYEPDNPMLELPPWLPAWPDGALITVSGVLSGQYDIGYLLVLFD